MIEGSDHDWAVLVDGIVKVAHSEQTRAIAQALTKAEIIRPGASGIFGGTIFSHELVHFIGGQADSNANLTRRIVLLLESRYVPDLPGGWGDRIWENVVKNVLKRYFEEDVHFRPGIHRVPRFLLNDITRYWRTICVDYAAKHKEQDGKKWALRNAKLRLSRKLLYAAGIAFCFNCQLSPPSGDAPRAAPSNAFIQSALGFAKTPPLEYLATFLQQHVTTASRRKRIAEKIFGSYNQWLVLMARTGVRDKLEALTHADAQDNSEFQKIRRIGSVFAEGLGELFFARERSTDELTRLSIDYVGF